MSTLVKLTQSRSIEIRGVRTHNLKGFDLDLPLRSLISVTGVSGAGKSSLAFDTLFAEGQRRYVETFSPYTRQFLANWTSPTPTGSAAFRRQSPLASLTARTPAAARSRTIAEIHDALALLYARAGRVMCRNCGHLVEPASPATVSRAIETWPDGTRYEIAFPVDVRAETDAPLSCDRCKSEGFTRVRVNGQSEMLDGRCSICPRNPRSRSSSIAWSAAKIRPNAGLTRSRRRLPRAWGGAGSSPGKNRGPTTAAGGVRTAGPITSSHSPTCSATTAPLVLCPVCEGFGRTMELDLGRIVPDASRTIRGGALAPWSTPAYQGFLQGLLDLADQLDIPVDVPFERLTADQVKRLLEGVSGSGFTGLKAFFEDWKHRAYKRNVRVFLSRWRRYQTCPACHGARLRPEALAVKIGGRDIASLSALVDPRRPRLPCSAWSILRRQPVAAKILAQIDSRLGYLGEIGLDYLTLDRRASSLSAGRAATRQPDQNPGLRPGQYTLRAGRAHLGLHPREVGKLIRVLQRLRDQGNTLVVVEHDHDVIRGCRSCRRTRSWCRCGRRPGSLQRPARRLFTRVWIADQRLPEPAQTSCRRGPAPAGEGSVHPAVRCSRQQPQVDRRDVSAWCSLRRDRRERSRQEHLGRRDTLSRTPAPNRSRPRSGRPIFRADCQWRSGGCRVPRPVATLAVGPV